MDNTISISKEINNKREEARITQMNKFNEFLYGNFSRESIVKHFTHPLRGLCGNTFALKYPGGQDEKKYALDYFKNLFSSKEDIEYFEYKVIDSEQDPGIIISLSFRG